MLPYAIYCCCSKKSGTGFQCDRAYASAARRVRVLRERCQHIVPCLTTALRRRRTGQDWPAHQPYVIVAPNIPLTSAFPDGPSDFIRSPSPPIHHRASAGSGIGTLLHPEYRRLSSGRRDYAVQRSPAEAGRSDA